MQLILLGRGGIWVNGWLDRIYLHINGFDLHLELIVLTVVFRDFVSRVVLTRRILDHAGIYRGAGTENNRQSINRRKSPKPTKYENNPVSYPWPALLLRRI